LSGEEDQGAAPGAPATEVVKKTSGRGQRDLKVKVKTARGRKLSSTRWLERQLNDPYVKRARAEGYRGRAAYKILELDDKFRLSRAGRAGGRSRLRAGRLVPGRGEAGQRARRDARQGQGRVLGIDLQEVEPVPGAEIHQLDFLEEGADDKVKAWLGGKADVVMSDMAAASSGHKQTDHLRIVALCEAAAELAFDVLEEGGTFVAKVLAGGAEQGLQATLKRRFDKVANVKPPASRSDSSEKFVVATGFRGSADHG
jgi:23S rRNA (uridine2552-2'-O)-methyltransferase